MTLKDSLIWIFILSLVMAFVVSDGFNLHDYSKRWPHSHWATVTPENQAAFALYWGVIAIGQAAIILRMFFVR